MYLFAYNDDECLLCTSYNEEYPGDFELDYLYYNAQVLTLKPTRQQAQQFYTYYVPAMALQTGILLAGKLEEIAFEGEIRMLYQGQGFEVGS